MIGYILIGIAILGAIAIAYEVFFCIKAALELKILERRK